VDDLLIEQILAYRQPSLVRLEVFEVFLFDIELDDAGSYKRNLVMACNQWQIFSTAKQKTSHAIWLVGGFNVKLGYLADEISVNVIGLATQQFRSVQHRHTPLPCSPSQGNKKPAAGTTYRPRVVENRFAAP